eukprot:763746-Hanusia_phi.AAC.2
MREGFASTALMQLASRCSRVHLTPTRHTPVAQGPVARQASASSGSPRARMEVVALEPRFLAGLASDPNPPHCPANKTMASVISNGIKKSALAMEGASICLYIIATDPE